MIDSIMNRLHRSIKCLLKILHRNIFENNLVLNGSTKSQHEMNDSRDAKKRKSQLFKIDLQSEGLQDVND